MTTDAFDLEAPIVRCSNCGGPQKNAKAAACEFCGVGLGPVQAGVAGAPWTLFWDMHSGGGTKVEPFEKIYIQAPEADAKVVFYKRFGRNPERVSCTCCGADYSIDESPTLAEASGYHRNLRYVSRTLAKGERFRSGIDGRYLEPGEAIPAGLEAEAHHYVHDKARPDGLTLAEYVKQPDVKIIPASEILPGENKGDVPVEGYVWKE